MFVGGGEQFAVQLWVWRVNGIAADAASIIFAVAVWYLHADHYASLCDYYASLCE